MINEHSCEKQLSLLLLTFAIVPISKFCMCELYNSVQTSDGVLRGTVVLQTNEPTVIACVHRCKVKAACIVYQDGLCTCMEEKETGSQSITTPRFWRRKDSDNWSYKGSIRSSITSGNWILLALNICYGSKGNDYGAFRIQNDAIITSVKLEHVSGLISCDVNTPTFGSGIWTCSDDSNLLTTFITNIKNEIIFPPGVTLQELTKQIKISDSSVYKLTEKDMVYNSPILAVAANTELRIWNANDLASDISDQNNGGTHCVNVYVTTMPSK